MWQLLAMAGIRLLQGKLKAKAQNQQEDQQFITASQEEAAAWQQNVVDNKAITDANMLNTIRTGYRSGMLNLQRAQGRKVASDATLSLGRASLGLLGAETANTAAAGTIGASADAALSDIVMKTNEARARQAEDFIQGEENFDTQLHDILTEGEDALRHAAKVRVRQAQDAKYINDSEVLATSLISTAGSYISSNMSLGLGK